MLVSPSHLCRLPCFCAPTTPYTMPKEIEFILKDFIRHVVELKAEEDPAGTGFHREFRVLREEQIQNKNENRFPTDDGKKETNSKKNRYKDILPRDDRRVKLTEIEGQTESDYINATFIEDVNGQRGYIAAQGPMPHTVCDFWRMMWQYNTEIVFMACKLKEDGRPKCERYWAEVGESMTFGDITVHTETEDEIQEHFYKRQLRAEKDGEVHSLTQFHYVGWPDHNTPSSPDALRTMIENVRNFRKHVDIPMVVHCSAGCGRTGTIVAIDLAWTLLDKGMIREEFSMFEIIKKLREQRMSMVQTPDQYEYTHMVMKSLCNEWLVSFSNHDYENIEICSPATAKVPDEEPEAVYTNVEIVSKSSSEKGTTSLVKETRTVTLTEPQKEQEQLMKSVSPVRSSGSETQQQGNKMNTKEEIVNKSNNGKESWNVTELQTDSERLSKNSSPVRVSPTESKQHEHKVNDSSVKGTQVGDTILTSSTLRPKTLHISDTSDAGEYVEVRKSASMTPTSPPPGLPNKKNPPSNFSKLDPTKPASAVSVKPSVSSVKPLTSPAKSPTAHTERSITPAKQSPRPPIQGSVERSTSALTPTSPMKASASPRNASTSSSNNFDPHKTVIMVGGGNTVPKIIQSGSVSVVSTKKRAPKPPAAQVVVKAMTSSQDLSTKEGKQQEGGKQQQSAVSLSQSSDQAKAVASKQDQNAIRKSHEEVPNENPEGVPDLPARNYSLEEVNQSEGVTTLSADGAAQRQTNNHATKVQPVLSSASTPAPSSSAVLNRPAQPLPVNQPHKVMTMSVKGPQTGSAPKLASGRQSQAVPGMVSAMGGHTHHAVPQKRSSVKSDKREIGGHPTMPVQHHHHHHVNHHSASGSSHQTASHTTGQHALHTHRSASTIRGKKVFKDMFACGRKSLKVKVPVASQVVVTKAKKTDFKTDRPPRVNGPRPMPKGWSTPSETTFKTYL